MSTEVFEFLLFIINSDYSDVRKHKIDITSDQFWRFFYVPNNSPEKVCATDNSVWTNSAWFRFITSGSFLDPQKVHKTLLKCCIAKIGVLTKEQIKKLSKESQ
jgi:hypothetical protein